MSPLSGIKKHTWLVLGMLFVLFAYRTWFFSDSILTYSDWQFLYDQSLQGELINPSIWKSDQFGQVNIFAAFAPLQSAMVALARFGFSFAYIERILFMALPLSMGFLGMYVLSYFYTKNSLGSVFAALFFVFNTYALILSTGHLTLLASMYISPWILFYYEKSLHSFDAKYAVITAIFTSIACSFEIRMVYIVSIALGALTVRSLLIRKTEIVKLIRIICIFSIVLLLLNSYWLLGLFSIESIAQNAILSRDLFGNQFMSVARAMTVFHPFWTNSYPAIFTIQHIPFYFWLFPFLAFMGFYLNKGNRNYAVYFFIALVGIALTKQANPPFPALYTLLYSNLPGFRFFREASKFYSLIIISYSVLSAATIAWMSGKIKTMVFPQNVFFVSLIFICFVVTLFQSRPLLDQSFGTLSVAREVPKQYAAVTKLFTQNNQFYRTLWVPTASRWGYVSSIRPKISLFDSLNTDWKVFLSTKSESEKTNTNKILSFISQPEFPQLLSTTGIRYVVVPLQDLDNDDNFYQYFSEPAEFSKKLDSLFFLRKLSTDYDIAVYEFTDWKPLFYKTKMAEKQFQSLESESLSYELVSSSNYKVTFSHVSGPLYFYLTESYHPQWQASFLPLINFESKNEKSTYVHNKSTVNTNEFWINPNNICQSQVCVVENDGTYTFSLLISFVPQKYFELGVLISLISVGVVFSFIILSSVFPKRIHESVTTSD